MKPLFPARTARREQQVDVIERTGPRERAELPVR